MKQRTILSTLTCLLLTLPLFASSTVRHDVSAAITADAITRLVVEIPYAHLTVLNGESNDMIDAYGYVTRSWRTSKQRDQGQSMVDDSNIRIDVEGTTAFVRRNHGPNAKSRSAMGSKSMYVIAVRIPRGTNIVVDQKKGSVTAKGRFASVDVELSSGDIAIEVPKKNVGELIARTRYGHLEVHLGDRIIENEGLFPRSAHYFYEGGQNVLTASTTRGNVSIKLHD